MRSRRPYIGLEPFQEADSDVFFGRTRDINIVVSNLYGAALTILFGPSGAGKSSLVRAGLASRLRAEPDTAVVVFSNWHDEAFSKRLAADCCTAVSAATNRPFAPPGDLPLDDLLCAAGQEIGGPVLLLLDQFEEYLLHPLQPATRDRFETEFARSINRNDVDAGFLIAIREDWLSRLDRFRIRIPNLLGNMVEVKYLDRRGAEEAVRGPIEAYNLQVPKEEQVQIEEELVRAVLSEADAKRSSKSGAPSEVTGQGIVPPVLQMILARIWDEERLAGSFMLRLQTLQKLGGAEEIARAHVEDVMRKLSVAERRTCTRVFFFLVTPSGVKTPYRTEDLAELAGTPTAQMRELLERLAAWRIVARIPNPERYEVFHDTLAPAVLRWRIEFEKQENRAEAERKAEEQRQRAEREAAAARRFRWLALMLAISLAAAVIAALMFERQRRLAFTAGLAAGSLQESETGDPERGILLALHAWREFQPASTEVERALHIAVQRSHIRATLRGHSGAVNAMAFASAAGLIVTAGADGTARIWDTAGKPLRTISAGLGPLLWVAVTATADRLATVGQAGSVQVWSGTSGAPIYTVPPAEHVTTATFSPDGSLLATASDTQVSVRDQAGRKLSTLPHDGHVRTLAFSPDGKLLATAGDDGECKLWRTQGWREDSTLLLRNASGVVDAKAIRQIAFSPGRARLTLAVALEDGTGRIYEVSTGKMLVSLLRDQGAPGSIVHGSIVQAVAFSPDGKRLATGSWDRKAVIWDVASGQEAMELRGHTDAITSIAFTGNSRVVSSSTDGTARIWDTSYGEESLSFSASATLLHKLAYSPDGSRIATASADGTAKIWDSRTGAMERSLPHGSAGTSVISVAFSHNSQRIATAGSDRNVKLWDAASGMPAGELRHPREVMDAAFSPDDRLLASAGRDRTIRIWDLASNVPPRELNGLPGDRTSLAFSPDGRLLVAGASDERSEVWDLTTNSSRALNGSLGVLAVAFSPRGDRIATASADATAALWDPRAATMIQRLRGHWTWVRSVTFSPDGKRLATAGRDGFVKLWDVASGQELLTIDARSGPLASVAFDPGGRYLAACGDDGVVRVYVLRAEELVNLARSRVTRQFTVEECQKYLLSSVCPQQP